MRAVKTFSFLLKALLQIVLQSDKNPKWIRASKLIDCKERWYKNEV